MKISFETSTGLTQSLKDQSTRQIRRLIFFFILALFLSGVTAIPIETQLGFAMRLLAVLELDNGLSGWLTQVHRGVLETNQKYGFIAYGTDWLAFAHFVIAMAFIGPLRDPEKNIWVIEFGLLACAAIIPFALIAGYYRGIPSFWQVIDCSFGIIGGFVLLIIHRKITALSGI
jgi:hypothetical protein